MACSALLSACGASVRAQDDGGIRVDAVARDATVGVDQSSPPADSATPPDGAVSMPDASASDTGVSSDSGPSTPDATVVGNARGEWRMTEFRFNLNGTPASVSETNRAFPGDLLNRYRINGTLDVTDRSLAFAWGPLRNDHAYVNDSTVEIDEGYSLTAFYWNGTLDDRAQRFVFGAISLDFAFESADVLRLSSPREGWIALFARDARTALPLAPVRRMTGFAEFVSASTSDRFTAPRAALLWDLTGGTNTLESGSVAVSLGATRGTYAFSMAEVPMLAFAGVHGVSIAFAHIVIYDDVDGSRTFNSSMTGGTGPDILRGVSPIGVAIRQGDSPTAGFATSPFRLLKNGWQFVNVERNSEPRPAVLIPYAMNNPVSPDVPIAETAVRRRVLDLIP